MQIAFHNFFNLVGKVAPRFGKIDPGYTAEFYHKLQFSEENKKKVTNVNKHYIFQVSCLYI
jgi:hypothetical protein